LQLHVIRIYDGTSSLHRKITGIPRQYIIAYRDHEVEFGATGVSNASAIACGCRSECKQKNLQQAISVALGAMMSIQAIKFSR